MSERTAIEWCDSTFNPWIGCTRVSPACDDCYAARSTPTRALGVAWGAGQPRRLTAEATWKLPARWNKQPFAECMGCGWRGESREGVLRDGLAGFDRDPGAMRCCPTCRKPLLKKARRRVFCASLADWLDNEVPIQWLVDLLEVVRVTPELDWLLLSKRIGNWSRRIAEAVGYLDELTPASYPLPLRAWLASWLDGEPPSNVWILATVVTQPEADRDVQKVLRVPARVRGLSIEPMLGPIDLTSIPRCMAGGLMRPLDGRFNRVDWVICGSESGPLARRDPAMVDWVRSLRDQCQAAGVAFLWKQDADSGRKIPTPLLDGQSWVEFPTTSGR